MLCPGDACPKRFSWFFYWIPEVQKRVHLIDLRFSSRAFKLAFTIYLQTSASIQPRTGLSKFAKNEPQVRKTVRTNIGF